MGNIKGWRWMVGRVGDGMWGVGHGTWEWVREWSIE